MDFNYKNKSVVYKMSNISQLIQEAMYLENRGFIVEAQKIYDILKGNLELLDENMLSRICLFYGDSDEIETVFQASKLGVMRSGEMDILVPFFLKSWRKLNKPIFEIEWLLKQPGMEHLNQERLLIAKYFFECGKFNEAYQITLEIAEKSEHLFRQNSYQNQLYVDAHLNLVELEYHFQNYTQARFHLRKLIYLSENVIREVQQIAYWSILFDEISNFVIRKDWTEISRELTDDVMLICKFYEQLSQSKLTKSLLNEIQNKHFEDGNLEKKRKVYLIFILKMSKNKDWTKDVEKVYLSTPHDLLASLLYIEYLKTVSPEKAKLFWKNEFFNHADKREAVRSFWENIKEKNTRKVDLEDCSVTFFGGGQKIGGTSILVSIKGHHLLLDAGMHLNEEIYYPDYSPMYKKGLTFDDLDALLITHAHMDHTGAVPYVHGQRTDLPIYATEPTKMLMKILLEDSVRMSRDEDVKKEAYTKQDVQNTILSIITVNFDQSFVIPSKDKEWNVTYYPSGHILGAGAIHLEIEGISILFTGDYSVDEQKTVKGIALPENLEVDILITESTYGYLPSNASIKREQQEFLFVESVKQTMDSNGSILIPAFAVGRSQEIILILKEAFKDERYLPFDLYTDGRVTDVCHVYERFSEQKRYINPKFYSEGSDDSVFFGGGVQAAKDIYSDRKGSSFTFNDFIEDYIMPGKNCIVASSGMLTENSTSARYAEHLIDSKRNRISFTGYMDEESPGHQLLKQARYDGGNSLKINGREKAVSANIDSFRLSAHANREQIIQLVMEVKPSQVFLMHGEHEKRYRPVSTIESGEKIFPSVIELLDYLNKDIKITPAMNGTHYFLNEIGE